MNHPPTASPQSTLPRRRTVQSGERQKNNPKRLRRLLVWSLISLDGCEVTTKEKETRHEGPARLSGISGHLLELSSRAIIRGQAICVSASRVAHGFSYAARVLGAAACGYERAFVEAVGHSMGRRCFRECDDRPK